MNKILIILLLFTTPVWAADWACWDKKGIVPNMIDGVYLSQGKNHPKGDCLKISRTKALSLNTPYFKYDVNQLGNDNKFVAMTQVEKDAYDLPEQQAAAKQAALIVSIETKLTTLGLTLEEVHYILSGTVVP